MWANAVESSLQISTQLTDRAPKIFQGAIDLYIQGPLQAHRSGHNERYPLQSMANHWIGGVLVHELLTRHLVLWRDERLLTVKANTVMRGLRIVRVLLDWDRDELGCDLKSNPARLLKVRGVSDARFPFITPKQKKQLLLELAKSKNPNHKRLNQLALTTLF